MMTQDELKAAIPQVITSVDIPNLGEKVVGKVRDSYILPDGKRALIATDRISAFDRVLGHIPYRGQVLNQLSAWWFGQLVDVVPNHLLDVPDENVSIVKDAEALPVEIIVRGYITGVTSTSMWTLYEQGERAPYGVILPDGMRKNDRLPRPALTPTTKADDGGHDMRILPIEIMERGLVRPDVWMQIEKAALTLFERGSAIAEAAGLVLVDTKYEFGLIDGQLTLIDEVHTPDSSRYWLKETAESDFPDHYDKEYLRMWYAERGYKGDGVPPEMTDDFIVEVAARYIRVFEMLTGTEFIPAESPAEGRIQKRFVGDK